MRGAVKAGLIGGAAVAALLGGLWLYRTPLVTHFVDRTLNERGVRARYTIEQLGFGTQRLTNISIGDATHPDVTAQSVELTVRLSWSGPVVTAVHARGVRARGRWTGQKFAFGDVDKLIPADDGEPFILPDLAVTLHDGAATLDTPWGRVGVGAAGRGNPARAFSGQLAVNAPAINAAGCHGAGLTANLAVQLRGGAPAITGPVGVASARCAAHGIAVADARIGLRLSADAGLDEWRGRAGFRSAAASVPQLAMQSTDGSVDFTGSITGGQNADWHVNARNASTRWLQAGSVLVDGAARREGDGTVDAAGTIAMADGRASAATLRGIAALNGMDDATPFGPVARQLGRAAGAA
ncbi:MAG: hypothetical protein ACKOUM_00055, partial [Sphingopyxis sp.]